MKLSNRAKSALATAGYPVNPQSAIAQLVAFSAQNSGLDVRNYTTGADRWRDGWKAYQTEARSISADWRRVKAALITAGAEGVTDADVIAEAPQAYSGRLEWNGKTTTDEGCPSAPHWEYCTGQYWPTEYRKAAATVLEAAIRRVRQARPPEKQRVTTIAQLKSLNARNGGCWFEPSSMRFFGTRIESEIIRGKFFITSEQPPYGSRKYSLRSFDEEGDVNTVGEFCTFNSKADALAAIPKD